MRTATTRPDSGGERGDGPDRGGDAEGVGDDAGEDRADGEAAVAPEPVDADGAGAPVGVGDVADRGEQRRVDHRGADAEQRRAPSGPRPEAGRRGDPADRDGLGEHAAGDEPLAADAVGEAAGDELAEAPDRRVDARRGRRCGATERPAPAK